ncbi:MAG TPA: helix-turn-helix transcriptional regulator [Streptosporangiaceae bacterium]|nr:helix-turn-helix transcriptional regulator [Streptosporangiaceae bacterium]
MYGDRIPGPGDLGRRIAARRRQLGWSRAELAAKAGLSVAYLTYLETHPALVTMTCLLGLADALETTAEALLGAGSAVPVASASPSFDDLWAADVSTGRHGERPGPFLG